MQPNYPDNVSLSDCCAKNKTKDQLQGKFVVHGNRVLHTSEFLMPWVPFSDKVYALKGKKNMPSSSFSSWWSVSGSRSGWRWCWCHRNRPHPQSWKRSSPELCDVSAVTSAWYKAENPKNMTQLICFNTLQLSEYRHVSTTVECHLVYSNHMVLIWLQWSSTFCDWKTSKINITAQSWDNSLL